MAHSSSGGPRGIHSLAAESRLSQKSWYALSISGVCGGGNLSTDSPARRQKRFQSALRKFQRFTGSLWAGTLNLGGVRREGRCCDSGHFPRTHLSGSRLSWPRLAKARSGLVPTFQRRENKLAVSFELYNSPRFLDVAQESRLSPSGNVLLQPQFTSWQLKSSPYRLGCSNAGMVVGVSRERGCF